MWPYRLTSPNRSADQLAASANSLWEQCLPQTTASLDIRPFTVLSSELGKSLVMSQMSQAQPEAP